MTGTSPPHEIGFDTSLSTVLRTLSRLYTAPEARPRRRRHRIDALTNYVADTVTRHYTRHPSIDADRAQQTLVRALQAAGEAGASLLGAAILAHSAFIPAWEGERDAALERMTAARTYARRGSACTNLLAWLDAVEAECETRCGSTRKALQLIQHAEDVLAVGSDQSSPEWMDWFSPVRLAAFKGNTQLKAGHLPQARQTLQHVLDTLNLSDDKQRTVVLGDLAAVEAAAGKPHEACRYALRALDGLERNWYAMGMDRVREVRRTLIPHQQEECVRELDDRLYGWSTAISALSR